MIKKPMIAIWKYNSYPYYLCGEVTKFLDNGYVETKEYGKGNCFKPLKLIWGKFAHTFRSRVDNLILKERAARKIHDQDWLAKANDLFDNEN